MILLKSRLNGFSVPDRLSASERCVISSISDAMRIAGLLLLYSFRDQGVRRCLRSQVMWASFLMGCGVGPTRTAQH